MTKPRRARWARRGRVVLLAAAVWVIGHELALGLAATAASANSHPTAPTAAQHGAPWVTAMVGVGILGAWTAVRALLRVVWLQRRLRQLGVALPAADGRRLAAVGRRWIAILVLAFVAFVLQENVEHLLDHAHLPGVMGLVSGAYGATLPVFAFLSLAAAILAVALERHVRQLAAAIRRHRPRRPPARVTRPAVTTDLAALIAARLRALTRVGGRAPPVLLSPARCPSLT